MTKTDIEQYLYEHIPITKALGVEAVEFSKEGVKFKAPLSNNINHRSTAFGGSISSLLITTGWSYLRLLFDEADPIPRIVIGKSTTNYLKPVKSNFTSKLHLPKQENVDTFLNMYDRFGKARILLTAQIEEDNEVLAEFKGEFVVLKP